MTTEPRRGAKDDDTPAPCPLDEKALDAEEAAELLRAALSPGDSPSDALTCLLAVSGGPDSMALMRLASLAAPLLPHIAFRAATVDHGLRPEARGEALFVAEVARRIGMPHEILTWDEAKPATGIQKAAREARYALLERHAVACGAKTLMTAHTSDDQAETILMRLARGSGIDGLAGMRRIKPLRRVTLARPLLDVPKSRLVATCAQQGWEYVEDPSNRDEGYTRVRIRALLPLLETEGLDPRRLLRLGRRAREASEALENCADRAFLAARRETDGPGLLQLDAEALAEVPIEILRRVLARAITAVSLDLPQSDYGPRRERLEALSYDVFAALRAGIPMPARSLAGVGITVEQAGGATLIVSMRRSAPRRQA
ncbi:MAG TPA: tRNA lysidine(34) synthetase TilS [Saliniramus sp.]|nr:tRNA lysidine(34) synthetase TilS [Saliniramus sp.]